MTEQTKKEIIKSFAYGYTSEKVADVYEIDKEAAAQFEKENVAEIEAKKAELKEAGWM